MNQEFFEHAMKLIDSWTPEDWESSLKDFGFDVRRKVVLLDTDTKTGGIREEFISVRVDESWSWEYELKKAALTAEFRAANDNSYALAA